MKKIQTSLLLLGIACLGSAIQPEEAQAQAAASCTFTTSDTYAAIENVSNVLTCSPSSSIGASIASKLIIEPSTSSSFHIGFINTAGTSWVRGATSVNVSGTGTCTVTGHNTQCTSLSSGDRVSFTDSSLSDFGTLSFIWNASASGVQRIGMVAASTAPGNGTQEKISSFMQNRATTILSVQPSISGFLDGSNLSGGGSLGRLDLSANAGSMSLAFSSSLSRIRAAQRGELAAKSTASTLANNAAISPSAHVNAYAPSPSLGVDGPGARQIEELDKGTKDNSSGNQPGSLDLQDRFDIWTEIYATHSKAGQSKADVFMGFLGAHYFVTPDMLVGAMVQIDNVDEKNGTSSANGTGWMAGPYLAGRISGQSLLYEVRAAWGQSSNKISPTGAQKDKFDTQRWLVTGQLKGDYVLSHINETTEITFNPFVRTSYFEERQEAYVNSLGSAVDAQTISLGETQFGPKLSTRIKLDNGVLIAPTISTSGIYTFAASRDGGSSDNAFEDGDLRARFDAGLELVSADDWRFDFSTFYDGLGVEDYEAYGGKVRLTIPLN